VRHSSLFYSHFSWDAILIFDEKRQAVDCYKKVLENNQTHGIAILKLGKIYRDQGKLDEGISYFQKILNENPNSISLLNEMGEFYIKQVNFEKAIYYFEKILSENPTYVIVLKKVAGIYDKIGNLEKAIIYLEKILMKEPKNVRVLHELGITYRKQNYYYESISCFQKILIQKSHDTATLCELGIVYREKGDYKNAIDCFNQLLTIDKRNIHGLRELGVTYRKQGNYEEAIRCFSEVLTENPNDAQALIESGVAHREKKDYYSAIHWFTKQLNNYENDEYALGSLGITYLELENYKKAKQYFERITVLNPNNKLAMIGLGLVHIHLCELNQATAIFLDISSNVNQHESKIVKKYLNLLKDLIDQRVKEREIESIQIKTQIETQKEMLSFLTHTLRNTLSGGPQTVEQVLRISQEYLGEDYQNIEVYKIINNIASLHSTFTLISSMLDTFKLYVSEPINLMDKWQNDTGNTSNLNHLFALVIRQTLGRVFFEVKFLPSFKRLLTLQTSYSIKEVRKSFLENILNFKLTFENSSKVLSWLQEFFPAISLKINCRQIYFNNEGIRFNFLFACLSELVLNSLKYSDGQQPIQINCTKQVGHVVFSCRNTFNQAGKLQGGTEKGLSFVEELTKIAQDIKLIVDTKNSVFISKLQLKENLLIGEYAR